MTDDEFRGEFREIRTAINELTQGLALLAESHGNHTEMLSAIMKAITEEDDGPSPLEEVLHKILHTLDSQTEVLEALNGTMGEALGRISGSCNVTPSVLLSEQNSKNNNNHARTTPGVG